MNRLLSILLVVVIIGGLIFGGLWFVNKNKKSSSSDMANEEEEEEPLKELPLEDKPYVTFTPGPSCEYSLSVSRILTSPAKVEYEIVYKDEAGVTQGASGSISPSAGSATKKILFGTESSGHRKCDKGVSGGDVTLRYRNDEGKLTSKLTGKFAVIEAETTLTLGKFTLELAKATKDKFVVIETEGLPKVVEGTVSAGPIGVFTSGKSTALSGTVTLAGEGTLQVYSGSKWTKLDSNKTTSLGTFVKTQ